MHKKLFFAFIMLPCWVSAQELLTHEEAVKIALEKNYSIRIAQRNRQIAENEVTLGNAGFLPIVTATLNRSNSYYLRYLQTRVNPNADSTGGPTVTQVQDFSDNTNKAFNYGATVNWTIFDGMGMFIAYERLQELEVAGYEQAQATIEAAIADVSGAYFNIIQLQERVVAFTEALRISEQRLGLAKAQYEVGSGSKLNYLAAQVDYNTDKSALIQQEQLLRNAKISLNQLLGRTPENAFDVSDTIIVDENLNLENIRTATLQRNPTILVAQQNINVAQLDRRLIQSQRLPQVNVFTGYTHGRQENRAFFLPLTNQTDLINYGISVAVPVFDGFNQRRRIQNARINEDIRELQLQDVQVQLEAAVQRAYTDYQNALILIRLEQENLKVARQNVDIAFERYQLGVSTALELREVQRNAVATASRLIDAAYNAKLAEIELQRLSSSIVQ